MRQENIKLLVPLGVLRVGEHARAGQSSLGNRHRNVRVAGDNIPVVVNLHLAAAATPRVVAAVSIAVVGAAGVAGGETAAEVAGEEIHIGETPRLDDTEV